MLRNQQISLWKFANLGVPRYLCIMFLRKKSNKSGSTSVQVIAKTKNRKQRVVKTIGSSRDTDEIERLMTEGRKYISDQNGALFPGIDEDENAVDVSDRATFFAVPFAQKTKKYLILFLSLFFYIFAEVVITIYLVDLTTHKGATSKTRKILDC